jgi:hypothetical protein
MNVWLKANPSFDDDDTLESFLSETKGLLMMFDAPSRYTYQDLPKFIIYVLQMFMHNHGDKSQIPYLVFGKQQKESKKVRKWRQPHEFYIDVSNGTERNFQEDVLVPLLRLIQNDQSVRIEDLPTKFTKRKPVTD